jgi:hypothetical protein
MRRGSLDAPPNERGPANGRYDETAAGLLDVSMTVQKYALIVSLVLVGVGLFLGLMGGVNTTGTQGGMPCGTPWFGETGTIPSDFSGIYSPKIQNPTDYKAACTDARQSRGTIALVIFGLGAVAVGASFVKRQSPQTA